MERCKKANAKGDDSGGGVGGGRPDLALHFVAETAKSHATKEGIKRGRRNSSGAAASAMTTPFLFLCKTVIRFAEGFSTQMSSPFPLQLFISFFFFCSSVSFGPLSITATIIHLPDWVTSLNRGC